MRDDPEARMVTQPDGESDGPTVRPDIIDELRAERAYQIDKWGARRQPFPRWMTMLGEEVGEACKAVIRLAEEPPERGMYWRTALRDELIQIAALVLAIVDQIDAELENSAETNFPESRSQ